MPASKRSAANASAPARAPKTTSISPSDDTSSSQEKTRRACLHRQLHKTKFCTYYLKGACHYGDECAFAHNCTELQVMPDLRKTRVCKAFLEDGCSDPDCTFAHGEEELISTGLFHKKSLCKWNEKGKCRNGDQCRFAHGAVELRGDVVASAAAVKASPTPPAAKAAAKNSRQQAKTKEAEPMKVIPAKANTPLNESTLAAAALASIGLPSSLPLLMAQLPRGWPGVTTPTLTALEAWQLHQQMLAMETLRGGSSEMDLFNVELQQIRANISALAKQCSQMQQHLPQAKREDRKGNLKAPPGLGGNSHSKIAASAADMKAALLENYLKFGAAAHLEDLDLQEALRAYGLSNAFIGA
jgi:hypothetical protein